MMRFLPIEQSLHFNFRFLRKILLRKVIQVGKLNR